MSDLTVSKLAERAGVSGDTVRYYERIGLLPEPDRSPSGYRLYGSDDVERLQLVKRAQRFGLSLGEIGELLDIREHGQCPCGHTRDLLQRRLATLKEEMATLAALHRDVEQMIEGLPGTGDRGWPCSSGLMQINPDQATTTETPKGGTR